MKQYFIKGILIAGAALFSVSAFAQKEKDGKKEKDHQTIIINREANNGEKTIIEITGDKVLINGKDAKDIDDITVNVHKIKAGEHALSLTGRGGKNWDLNIDNNGVFYEGNRISLFSEDSNRAMLGIVTDINDKGVEITSVSKESAAEKAGLKKGDIITKIEDKKIENMEDVSEVVRAHKPGDKVAITILRGGKEQILNAELARWKGVNMGRFAPGRVLEGFNRNIRITSPPSAPGVRTYSFETNRPKLGLSIQDTDDGKGVKVLDVESDGAAAKAGLKQDDVITHVNEIEVNSTDEISKLMRESREKTSVQMQVLRAGRTQKIDVRIPRKLKTANL